VEEAETDTLIANPLHPYTQALFSAVPRADPGETRKRIRLTGEPPKATEVLRGCAFASRCPLAEDHCHAVTPPLGEKGEGHLVGCHLVSGES
jgi:oligopeptide/dipeptide ABC transporter ATP-binding protein